MRIQSITDVNTQQQPNPFSTQKADSITAGKNASLVSFKECLRSQMQDVKAPAATRKAELSAVSYLWSYIRPQRVSHKPEVKAKTSAYAPLSDL